MLVTAISAYSDADLAYIQSLGEVARVMSSPNITLGINFLILAARLLREIAPHADIAILEEHFRDKPEVSGTARKIAESLHLQDSNITSLRLGGIVGHHEVVFGFPYQTVRLSHDSIRREAFGTGAAFALRELAARPEPGYFSFEDLLMSGCTLNGYRPECVTTDRFSSSTQCFEAARRIAFHTTHSAFPASMSGSA